MVVHNFNILCGSILFPPTKANPPLVIDPDTVLPDAIPFQGLQTIPRQEIEDRAAWLRNLTHPIGSGRSSRLPRTSQHDAGRIDVPCPGNGNSQSHAYGIPRRVSLSFKLSKSRAGVRLVRVCMDFNLPIPTACTGQQSIRQATRFFFPLDFSEVTQ